ncbi:MAG: polysaccharide deacetylase family protein [Erysipelotrichaceae bacterium]|nr:polysaccharide deacetylase family protein [Erysipelotrichaceae bacterium]
MNKKKKANFLSLAVIIVLSAALVALFTLFFVNFDFIGKKSIHEEARTYKTRHCLAFYPDSKQGLSFVKQLCKGEKNDPIYDYTLVPYGDYYLVNYGGENRYFADQNFEPVVINEIGEDGQKVVLDYLRYTFKKEDPDKYYNASFLEELQLDKLDFSTITYDIDGENIIVDVPQYEKKLAIPLKYMQKYIGMDFGFENEVYRKPVYLDPDESHPLVCLTFDDGPQLHYEPGDTSTERIVDLLYKYDATGTFYVIGVNLEDREIWADYQLYTLLKRSINQGNEYGSHTQTHSAALTEFKTAEGIREEIYGPVDYLKDFMDYEVVTYRPVEGAFDQGVLDASDLPAILWDVDSEDWMVTDPQDIIDQVLKYDYETGDIILFHDIYDESADALETIIPELINRGCQLVTITDLFRFCNIDPSMIDYFFSPSYYE